MELAQPCDVVGVQHGALLDRPVVIAVEVATLELFGAGHRLRVIIEGVNAGRAETARGEREETAAGAYVKKAQPAQVFQREHLRERFFGLRDTLVVEHGQKAPPVLAELETTLRLRQLLPGHLHKTCGPSAVRDFSEYVCEHLDISVDRVFLLDELSSRRAHRPAKPAIFVEDTQSIVPLISRIRPDPHIGLIEYLKVDADGADDDGNADRHVRDHFEGALAARPLRQGKRHEADIHLLHEADFRVRRPAHEAKGARSYSFERGLAITDDQQLCVISSVQKIGERLFDLVKVLKVGLRANPSDRPSRVRRSFPPAWPPHVCVYRSRDDPGARAEPVVMVCDVLIARDDAVAHLRYPLGEARLAQEPDGVVHVEEASASGVAFERTASRYQLALKPCDVARARAQDARQTTQQTERHDARHRVLAPGRVKFRDAYAALQQRSDELPDAKTAGRGMLAGSQGRDFDHLDLCAQTVMRPVCPSKLKRYETG